MSDFSDEIRDAFSGAAVEILTELGEVVTYSNRGGTAVSLYAAVDDITKTMATRIGIDIEDSRARFTIARTLDSTGAVVFPPTNGVAIDDEITFGGYVYPIDSFKVDSTGAIFDFECERSLARRIV